MQTKAKIYVLTCQKNCIRLGFANIIKRNHCKVWLNEIVSQGLNITCVGRSIWPNSFNKSLDIITKCNLIYTYAYKFVDILWILSCCWVKGGNQHRLLFSTVPPSPARYMQCKVLREYMTSNIWSCYILSSNIQSLGIQTSKCITYRPCSWSGQFKIHIKTYEQLARIMIMLVPMLAYDWCS